MEKKSLKKILVVALDNVGDAVMATATLKPLKEIFPQAEIDLWVKEYVAGLFQGHSHLHHVHASDPFWDRSPGTPSGSFSKFMETVSLIKKARYDVAIVLNSEWRRAMACLVANVSIRVGYHRRKSGLFLTASFPPPSENQHFVADHLNLIAQWANTSIDTRQYSPFLELTADDQAEGKFWLEGLNLISKQYTALHLFSGDDKKNWPLSSWATLIEQRLAKFPNERFVVICGPGEESKLSAYRDRFVRNEIPFVSSPSLGQLKFLLHHANLFVGGDSGPGHVAAALGTPVLSLFGPTRPQRSRPMGKGLLHVIQFTPLQDLAVSEVVKAMDQLVARV